MVNGSGYVAGQPGDGTVGTFITNLYRELLGRDSDPAGFAYWTALAASGDRGPIVQGFLASPEYVTHYLSTLYQNFLGRAPDPVGLQYFSDILQSHHSDLQILSYILGSPEYFIRSGNSNAGFITALYRDLLGRVPDAGGLAYWTGLANDGMTRSDLVLAMLLTPEGIAKLVNGNFAQPVAVPNSPPGTPQGGLYALAHATGNGLGNLYFQGNYDPNTLLSALMQFVNNGRTGISDQDVIVALLSSAKYFDNT